MLVTVAIAIGVALPVAYLAIVILGEPAQAWAALRRDEPLALLARSLALALSVAAAATALAVPLAWLTARTDLPGRRAWTVLAALPLVIPSYIGAYLLVSALGPHGELQSVLEPLGVDRLPNIYGFGGAWLVLTLFTYPLVLLPVRAALLRLDPQLEDAAKGMGRSPGEVFRSVILPQLIPAIGAGALLVALYALSDFGAVSILRFDSLHARDLPVVPERASTAPEPRRSPRCWCWRCSCSWYSRRRCAAGVTTTAAPPVPRATRRPCRSGAGAGLRSASARSSPGSRSRCRSRC